jgi:hypothetical protein
VAGRPEQFGGLKAAMTRFGFFGGDASGLDDIILGASADQSQSPIFNRKL